MSIWAAEVPWEDVAHLSGRLCLCPPLWFCLWNWMPVLYSLPFFEAHTPNLSLCSELPHKQPSETESLCQQERGGKHYFLCFAPGDPELKAWQSILDLLREALPGWKPSDGTVQRRLRVLFHVSSFIHSLSVDKLSALNLGWGRLRTTAVAYQTRQYSFLIIVNFSVTSGYVVLWIGNNLIWGRPC